MPRVYDDKWFEKQPHDHPPDHYNLTVAELAGFLLNSLHPGRLPQLRLSAGPEFREKHRQAKTRRASVSDSHFIDKLAK